MSTKYAFSEVFDSTDPATKAPINKLPIGLAKCKEFGIMNVVLEIDLNYYGVDYEIFTVKKICEMLKERFE